MPRFYQRGVKLLLSGVTQPRCVLLAEGDSEAFFFDSWLTHVGADPARHLVLCFQGLSKLGPYLHLLTQEPNFPGVSALGLMLDADNNLAARSASVAAHLQNAGILAAGVAAHVGQIVNSKGRRVAVFLSPGANQLGSIESLVINEIQQNPQWGCIDALGQCVNTQFGTPLDPKSVAQIYISLRLPSLCGVGRAFEARVFDVSHPAYASVRATFQPLIS